MVGLRRRQSAVLWGRAEPRLDGATAGEKRKKESVSCASGEMS